MTSTAKSDPKEALDRLNAAMFGDPRPVARALMQSFEDRSFAEFPLTEKAKLMRRLANRCKASERSDR